MVWRLQIEHTTEYEYAGDVLASYNEARITPCRDYRHLVLDHQLEIRPAASVLRYYDYWGSEVCAFGVYERHQSLTVTGRSVVETPPPAHVETPRTWPELRTPEVVDEFHEFLAPSRFVDVNELIAETAAVLARDRSPRATVDAVVEWIRANLEYVPGATDVSTTAAEALDLGRGVCQDFVHIAIALLRAAGVPARYASGYLHPHDDAVIGGKVTGQSHAWLEAWLGDWEAVDPTNGAEVGSRHVLVARGRDYADVVPLKGVFHGPPGLAVDVRVEITRVA